MDIREGKVLIIANPAAKNGEGAKAAYHVRRLLRDALGADAVDEVQTNAPGHAIEVAAAAAGQYATIITIGGDGVIHEAANGLMLIEQAARPNLGIVPVGSGNDYARTLGMSENVEQAVAQLLTASTRPMDAGDVNGEYFVETFSFGLDAAIALGTVERRKTSRKTGGALYFEVGIDQLLHHLDSYHVRARFDSEHSIDSERSIDTTAIMFAVQIGRTYGGGFIVCPDAAPNDGMFDICFAEGAWSIPRAVMVFARAKSGKHTTARGIRFEQASTVQIDLDVEPPAQADGEKITGSSFSVRMHERALQVLVPQSETTPGSGG